MRKVVVAAILLVIVIVIVIPAVAVAISRGTIFSASDGKRRQGEDVMIRVYMADLRQTAAIPLEEYVRGVVAAEMPAEFEIAALKAQAVAARTYAVKHMQAFGGAGLNDGSGADVSSDYRQNQAFLRKQQLEERWGTGYDRYWAKISRAVEETSGQILTYDGEAIYAVFHSQSGANTASAKEVWGVDYPYLRSVPCRWDQQAPKHREDKVFTLAEVERRLGTETQVAAAWQSGHVAVQILATTDSGRVAQLRIGSKLLTGSSVRQQLELRSTNFQAEIQGDKMIFHTVGYGHGVGLCQYGANGMAKEGSDYRQILSTYYTGAVLQHMAAQ